jgi:hypothetical protein
MELERAEAAGMLLRCGIISDEEHATRINEIRASVGLPPVDDAWCALIHDPWKTAHESVDEALQITQTDRNKQNGDPEDNFAYIALTWTALLRARGLLAADQEITAPDVARMMAGLKLCRDSNAPHRDNRVDLHGYGLCLERVEPAEGK